MTKGARILVVRLGAFGDILHALPAIVSLKQSFPASHLTWVVHGRWRPLLEGNAFVDEVLEFDRRKLSSWLELRKKLRSTKYDFAVDFQGLMKSALVASMARPERIYGYCRSCAREKLATLFYSNTVRPDSVHVVDRNIELAATAGAKSPSRAFPLPAGKPEGELPPGRFVLASPFAGWKSKQWPMERYRELAQRLKTNGTELVLNTAEPLREPGIWNHVSGLPGLIHATRQATAVLGIDSGPMHLAAALGRPGVAIFGPTDPARNGPYGNSFTVIRSPGAATTYKREDEFSPAMLEVSVDQVLEALARQLSAVAHS